jgi:hypothetical protein
LVAIWLLSPEGSHRKSTKGKACNFVQNTDSQRVSWKGQLPVPLYIHNSVPEKAYAAINRAIEDYHQRMGREMFHIVNYAATGPMSPQKDGHSTIYWFNQWEPERAREQARTTLFWEGDQIIEADIRINAVGYGFIFDSRGLASSIDFESLMVHELGHVLGLTHDSKSGSVMNVSLDDGELRRQLGTEDLASLRCEY